MCRSAPSGRPRHLTEPLRFQVLRVGFAISADDPAVARQLRYLVQSAVQPQAVRSTVTYAVRHSDGAYQISRNGAAHDLQFDSVRVLETVHREVERDALAAWPEAAVLRTLTGSWRGERFVVVGESLRDRSRLGLHLLSRGADVEADELAILHDGVLTAYPRPLHVFGPDAPLPPRSPSRDELPFLGANPAIGAWALDLSAADVDWRITTGPIDRIVLLEANYGGQTRLHPVSHSEAVRILMSCCDARGNVPGAIKAVAKLADGARCCRLWLGAPEEIGHFWPVAWRDSLSSRNRQRSVDGRDSRSG